MLKWHSVRLYKVTEDGAFALIYRLHRGEFDSSKVPTHANLPSKAKKSAMYGGQPGGGGGGWGRALCAAGIRAPFCKRRLRQTQDMK